jgi:hypothetical protein
MGVAGKYRATILVEHQDYIVDWETFEGEKFCGSVGSEHFTEC